MSKSFKPVVKTVGDPTWRGNALRFRTHAEALESARELSTRWLMVTAHDAHPSEDEPNYELVDGRVRHIQPGAATGDAS